RGRVRLYQHVGNRHLVLEVGPRAGMARVFVAADIEPRPAEEGALHHAGDVVGHEVVAEAVAFVGRAPPQAGLRLDREADAIADASGVDLPLLAIGIEGQHGGTLGFAGPGRTER